MLPVIQIEFLTIRTTGLALIAGLWFGLDVASRFAARRGINVDRAYSLGFWAVVTGLLAARLSFVIVHLNTYLKIIPWHRALGSAFALMPGTEIAPVGVLAALVTAWLLVRRWRMPLLETADSYSAGLAVLGISIGAAALLGGEMYGLETSLPWAIDLWGGLRHPTQIYFMLGCIAALAVLWRLDRQKGKTLPPGSLAQWFLILMGVTLLLVEPLRADSPVIFGTIRLWEVIGLVGIVSALAGFAIRAPASPGETTPDRAV